MVRFNYLKIKNYRSIKEAMLVYTAGIWHVVGNNNDAEGFKSNGSGKTTALLALQQCLFNRTTFGSNIEDTYHKLSVGYRLETEFTINGVNGDRTFRVTNSREPLRILIEELVNDEYVDFGVKSLPQALVVIQDIIGADFNTFVAMTYVSHGTVVNLIENFTSSTLIKAVLDFDSIYALDKAVKVRLSEQQRISTEANQQIKSNNSTLDVLKSFTKVNTKELNDTLDVLHTELDNSQTQGTALQLKFVTATIDNVTRSIKITREQINNLHEQLNNPVCKCCGHELDVNAEQVNQQITSLEAELVVLQKRYNDSVSTQAELSAKHEENQHRLNKDIAHFEQQLVIANYKNEQYELHANNVKKLTAENKKLNEALSTSIKEQEILTAIINSIKSGAPFKQLISNFCDVMNLYIKQYSQLMSTSFAEVKATPKKNSIELVTTDTRFKKIVNFTDYSGGELTRLRVVILMSVLNTVQTLTNVSTNVLIFDEALDTLDSSAANDLSNLFEYLSNNDNKFVALVSHGAQLSEIKFDGDITVTKDNGVSTLLQGI